MRFASGLEMVIQPEKFLVKMGGGVTAIRRQLPLRLAWAISVHKSQVHHYPHTTPHNTPRHNHTTLRHKKTPRDILVAVEYTITNMDIYLQWTWSERGEANNCHSSPRV